MGFFDKDFKEIFSSQIVSIIGGLFAGFILAIFTNKLLLIPGMLILIPGLLEMRGNISGSFASRLASGLFLGVIKPGNKKSKLINGNLVASFFLALIVSLALGVIAYLFNSIIFHIYMPKIILISLVSGVIANFIEIPLALSATFYLFRKGHDPNNIMGPFITSTGDIITILSLVIGMMFI